MIEENIKTNRNAKDSVFVDLFGNKGYLLELYNSLHPEDTSITEDRLEIVTLKPVVARGLYNDLGFIVDRLRLILLIESQSTWSVNILIRLLIYLAHSYQERADETEQSMYSSKTLDLPKPELYVIYTGDKENVPDEISLSQEFFNGEESCVEVKVRVIHQAVNNNIISQYINFCKVFDEQVRIYGRTVTAIKKTIEICINSGILSEYLRKREQEVERMTLEMFSQEAVTRAEIREARKETILIAIKRLRKYNFSDEDILESIMEDYDLSEGKARAYLEESKSGSNLDAAEDDFDRRLKDLEEFIHSQSEQ